MLTAHESGIENVVAFLTENLTALQLEQLAALMDERKRETLEFHGEPYGALFFAAAPGRP